MQFFKLARRGFKILSSIILWIMREEGKLSMQKCFGNFNILVLHSNWLRYLPLKIFLSALNCVFFYRSIKSKRGRSSQYTFSFADKRLLLIVLKWGQYILSVIHFYRNIYLCHKALCFVDNFSASYCVVSPQSRLIISQWFTALFFTTVTNYLLSLQKDESLL